MKKTRKLLVVGGVAGGASCAARARRLSEDAEIIIFERGPYISFANCGLPYYVGNIIAKERSLIVASPELFKKRFNIDVRTENNVRYIDRNNKEIEVENLQNGRVYRESYDALVLSPGAAPLRPRIDGIDIDGIFTLRTIPDMRKIVDWIKTRNVKQAAIVGGGFIGLEMTENLKIRGIDVIIIEMQQQLMPVIDPEIAVFIQEHLKAQGVALCLGSPVVEFKRGNDGIIAVKLASGQMISAEMIILAMGIRPEVELAKAAGLAIGDLGGILVDDSLRTSDASIWAVGDAVQVKNYITGFQNLVPLAGPANRQGRLAADFIMGNDFATPPRFRGVQATMVCGVLGLTIAATGLTERYLEHIGSLDAGEPYEKIYLHPSDHATYYPGAETMVVKLLFSTQTGRILGAQAIGKKGVEKRIDVISMAIQKNGTVFDLEEAELCYAPQFGSAKDPVNIAGMIASNVLRGYGLVAHWEDLAESDVHILDVREPFEFKSGHLENAVNIPLGNLRSRLSELDRNREIWAYCAVGQRSYFAARILDLHGFKVKSLSGGYMLRRAVEEVKRSA